MKVEEKIRKMEQARGQNRPLPEMRKLLDQYLPGHQKLAKIQIVGTNGKGSTALWLMQLGQKAGLKTGLFTSPHLVSHFERIRCAGVPIEAAEWEAIYDRWSSLFKKQNFTMFEMDLWMALDYFIANDVDLAIMEAGLGGRKDATTALDYKALLITNAGMDHMEYLGGTIEQIAVEKAGAMKPGVPVICGEKDSYVARIFQRAARRQQAPFYQPSLKGRQNDYEVLIQHGSRYLHFDLLKLPSYQLPNFSLAYNAFKLLELPLIYEDVQEVIDNFCWPARFHQISAEPYILVDGAHNVPGIKALTDSIIAFNGDIYFSGLKDKNLPEMIRILQTLNCPITLVQFDTMRKADLKRIAQELNLPMIHFESMMADLHQRSKPALVCGSLYFAGEVLKAWYGDKPIF